MGKRAQRKRAEKQAEKHVRKNLLEPAEHAERMRAAGHDVRTGLVTTNLQLDLEGVVVRCVGCGRTARLLSEPPGGKVVVCPQCVRSGRVKPE